MWIASYPDRVAPRDRNGAILLLVLSLLTLFLMLGTLMIVLATRARATARAFANAIAGPAMKTVAESELLEDALLRLLRGPLPAPAGQPGGPDPANRESLLADRYGIATLSGQLQSMKPTGPSLLEVVVGFPALPPNARELVGRVLTIQPGPNDPAPVTSYRIHTATKTPPAGNPPKETVTLELANLRTLGIRPLPTMPPAGTPSPHRAHINGRDFDAEAWDAFDDQNAFLTRRLTGQPVRAAFAAAPGGEVVDNDGDGIPDGIWIDDILPPMPDGTRFRVSYLVHDLGGALNVNTHGSGVPLGSGVGSFGPAAVDGAVGVPQDAWDRILSGTKAAIPLTGTSRRRPPEIGFPIDGRFGAAAGDSYALRLDFDGPRFADRQAAAGAPGNAFTCGELEWVLRQFDADTTTLPPRLAALLAGNAENARLFVTTDSWDTCGIVGDAATRLLTTGAPASLPEDARAGVRFNLDRPLSPSAPRELAMGGNDGLAAKGRFFNEFFAVITAAGVPADAKTAQWVANVIDFLDEYPAADDQPEEPQTFTPPNNLPPVTGVEPSTLPEALRENFGTLVMAKLRPFDSGFCASAAMLLGVPPQNKTKLEEDWDEWSNTPTPEVRQRFESLAVTYPQILDVVNVASPFRTTVFTTAADGQTFCRWREPGRINVNTCDPVVWQALSAGNGANPFDATAATPTVGQSNSAVIRTIAFRGSNPLQLPFPPPGNRVLANRVANIATTRSDVFAVWITLETTSPSGAAGGNDIAFSRLFAIIDRSIPVGHVPGMNLNVRDTIRLIRRLE